MGSDESHFNVSLIERDKVTRQCPQTTTFEEKRRAAAESNRSPSAYQPNALPLGQTGSRKKLKKNAVHYDKTQHANFRGKSLFKLRNNIETTNKRPKMRCRTLVSFLLTCFFMLICVSSKRQIDD